MDSRNCQTLSASPAMPGGLLRALGTSRRPPTPLRIGRSVAGSRNWFVYGNRSEVSSWEPPGPEESSNQEMFTVLDFDHLPVRINCPKVQDGGKNWTR
jgi:hypothetical protein